MTVGGIAATTFATNCYNTGNITAVSPVGPAYAGGIVGYSINMFSTVPFTNCYSIGEITATSAGTAYAGGIAGLANGKFTNCYYLIGTAPGLYGGTDGVGVTVDDGETAGTPPARTADSESGGKDPSLMRPSLSQAQKLKSLSADGVLDEPAINTLMREQKGNQREQIKIPYEKVKSILKNDMPLDEIEGFILRAIVDYQRKLQRQLTRDAR